jgi:PTS system mannose-specific IID component
MQGLGFGLAMGAWARKAKLKGEVLIAFLHRSTSFFNSHPIMSSYALGAITKLESEGASEEQISELKSNLIGPLGLLGDQIFWSRLKPLLATLLVMVIMIINYPIIKENREANILTLAFFLIAFNFIQFGLRWRGLQSGFKSGATVLEKITNSRLVKYRLHLALIFALCAGVLLPLANYKLKNTLLFFSVFIAAIICMKMKLPIWTTFLFGFAVFLIVSLISSVRF